MQTAQETALPVSRHVSPHEAEQRLILHGVSWVTYERLLADFQDSHAAHFAYDRGALEIMVLSLRREKIKHIIATLAEVLAEELGIDGEYREHEESAALPGVTGIQLSRFIEESQELRRPVWLRRVREWARQRKD